MDQMKNSRLGYTIVFEDNILKPLSHVKNYSSLMIVFTCYELSGPHKSISGTVSCSKQDKLHKKMAFYST